MAEIKHTPRCPYCRLMSGEYFSPKQIGTMKPYCTSYDCKEILELEAEE